MCIRFLFFFYFLVCLTSCGPSQVEIKQVVVDREVKMTQRFLTVDDSVISNGDPMKIIEPVWRTVDIYGSKEKYDSGMNRFSDPQRAVFAVMWYRGEVGNGGHSQFYTNSTGILWEDAMKGFELIGIVDGKKIIEESVKRYGERPSFAREKRLEILESRNIDFEDLDSRLYTLDSAVNFNKRILNYIQKNKSSFYFSGNVIVPE
jgi:hypothetical protein